MKRLSALLAFIACPLVTIPLAAGPALAAPPAIPPFVVVKASKPQTTALFGVKFWGDSLTQGGNDFTTGTLATGFSAASGIPAFNYGVGGQLSTQIAMRGGFVATTLTFSGNAINGNGNSTTISAVNGVALAGTSTSQDPDYRLYSTVANNTSVNNWGTVCGVHGYIKRSGSGGPPSTSESYSFVSDFNYTSTTYACAANSAFVPDLADVSAPFVFEGGRNNISAQSTIYSDWASAASAANTAGNTGYLFLSVLNGDYSAEQSGQSTYNSIITENNYLAATYPGHVWDWRSWLVAQYNPANPVDVLNHTNDVTPYTARAQSLTATLNGSITSSGCPTLTITKGSLGTGFTLKIDNEYIYATTVSGSVVTSCVRNYGTGGAGAASHNNGVAVTGVDPLHLSGATYAVAGAYIAANYLNVLIPPGLKTSYLSPYDYGNAVTGQPPAIGNPTKLTLANGRLQLADSIMIPNGAAIQSTDSTGGGALTGQGFQGNVVTALKVSGSVVTLGGGAGLSWCGTTGGGATACQQGGNRQGDFVNLYSYMDQSYSYNTPTTGQTVTMADTSDFAIIEPAGTLSTLTLTLPTCSATYKGKIARAAFTQNITTLTVGATAGSVSGAPTAITAPQGVAFICRDTNTTWYRF
jgi:hypothetical protein